MLTLEVASSILRSFVGFAWFLISIFQTSPKNKSNEDRLLSGGSTSEPRGKWVRPLGYVERFMTTSEWIGNMSTVYGLWLDSTQPIPFDAIKQTAQLMFRKMPHLRLCLGSHKNDTWWREMDVDRLDIEEVHSDEGVISILESLLKRKHNTEKGPLWFVRFLKIYNESDFNSNFNVKHKYVCLFGFHHNFSDGTTNMNFCNIFLDLLNGFLQNKVLDLKEVGRFAYPIQDDIAKSNDIFSYTYLIRLGIVRIFKYVIAYGSYYVKNFLNEYQMPSNHDGCTLILQNELNEFATSCLLKRCKMEGVTLNSAFTAAANIGMHRMILQRNNSVVETRFDSQQTINMRRYWPKDEQKNSYGCHIFTIGIKVPTKKEDFRNFWEYARQVHEIMYQELYVEKNSLKSHPLSHKLSLAVLLNLILSKLNLTSSNDSHYCITNMGNVSSIFSGNGEIVSVSKILRSVSCHFMPSLCQHTLQTFKGKFYYSLDYYPQKMSVGTARTYVSSLMDTLRTAIHLPN